MTGSSSRLAPTGGLGKERHLSGTWFRPRQGYRHAQNGVRRQKERAWRMEPGLAQRSWCFLLWDNLIWTNERRPPAEAERLTGGVAAARPLPGPPNPCGPPAPRWGHPLGCPSRGQGVDRLHKSTEPRGGGSLAAQSRAPPNPQRPPLSRGSPPSPTGPFLAFLLEKLPESGACSPPPGDPISTQEGLVQGGVILRKGSFLFLLRKLSVSRGA